MITIMMRAVTKLISFKNVFNADKQGSNYY